MEEDQLLDACVKGKPSAQKLLFDRFAPKMMGVILRYINDKERANDVLQDGFIKVFKHLKTFKKDGSFEGWMRRIMVNTALDQLRKDKKKQLHVEIDNVQYPLAIESKAEGKMQADTLMELVQSLPDGYRMVFNLYAIEGYTHKEIGEMLNIAENTSKSQYSRARGLLRNMLKDLEIER